MIRRTLVTLLLSLLLIPSWAGAQMPGLKFEVQGIDNKTLLDMRKQFPTLEKNPTDPQLLDEVLRWLITRQHYDSGAVRINDTGTHVLIKVGRIQRIHSILWKGVRTQAEADLRHRLGYNENDIFDKDSILQSVEKVRQFYRENGFFNASIQVQFSPVLPSDFDVHLDVNEGVQTKIGDVSFTCANPLLRKQLQKRADSHLNDPYTLINLNGLKRDLRQFLQDNHYLRADFAEPIITPSSDETKVSIVFKIDRPEEYRLEITGPLHETPGNVRDATGFDNFDSTANNMSQELAQRVRNYYNNRGYARVDVVSSEQEGENPYQRRILLDITEGPKIGINSLVFAGRLSQPSKFYSDFLYNEGNDAFSSKIYVKDELDRTLKDLVIDRKNNGYFRARIVSSRTVFNESHDQVDISVNMDEGPLTQIQKISFEGNVEMEDSVLLKTLGLKPLESLRLNQFEAGLANIKKYYHDNGFLEAKILNEQNEKEDLVTYNEDNTLAKINVQMQEGPKVIVGSIVIEGNAMTKDYVILKELEFKVGDVLTPKNIEESKARLQRLGLFTAVDIRMLEENSAASYRTILVSVADRDPGLINAGLGATNERRLTERGYAGVGYRNIGGTARAASLRSDLNYLTDISYLEKKIVAGYLEPYLFDTRMKGRITLTQASFVEDFNALTAIDLSQANFSIEQQLTSHFLASWNLWTFATYYTYSAVAAAGYQTTDQNIGSVGPSLEIDYRDNIFNPTKGTFTRWNAEYGSPALLSSNTIQYWRSTLSVSKFVSLRPGWVWANNAQGGYLQNLMPNGSVPYDKKGFLLGGETTIRGFALSEAFPNSNDLGNTSYPLMSQATMYLIKSELRFPLKGNIGGAIFFDGGQVMLNDFPLPFGFRDSAGFALRYNTPVGPLSLEMGWKLNMDGARGEGPYNIDVAIGTF